MVLTSLSSVEYENHFPHEDPPRGNICRPQFFACHPSVHEPHVGTGTAEEAVMGCWTKQPTDLLELRLVAGLDGGYKSTKAPCWGDSTIWPAEPKECALSLVASQAETMWRFRQAAWPPFPAKPLQPAPPLSRQIKWKHGFTGLPGTFLSHGPHEAEEFIRGRYGAGEPRMTKRRPPGCKCGL
jgi:hypothetical protein